MDEEIFDIQIAAELYRKWFKTGHKNPSQPYDKEQINELYSFLRKSLDPIIQQYSSQSLKVYRAEIPFLFIGKDNFETFTNEIFVLNNTIHSVSMFGCMAVGSTFEEAFSNYLYALIECTDARYRMGMKLKSMVYTMKIYGSDSKDVDRVIFKKELIEAGWNIQYEGLKNTVLIKEGNEVTFTLPKSELIDHSIVFWFRKLQLQISELEHNKLYR